MNNRYKAYPEYKDSGVEWLGDIPSHWIQTLLKRYCVVTDGSHHSPKIQSIGLPFISVTDVGVNKINFEDSKKISNDDYLRLVNEGCKPKVGDILLTKDGTIGRAAIVKNRYPDFVILSSLGLLSPLRMLANRFLYYYLISGINIDQMNSLIHGSALRRMTINKIDNLQFVLPPLVEQKQIANFLDYETAKIDTLIEKQQELIKLLKEKRQSVISHAVTKGLDPNVPMKDSGIEWLGEMPEHWEICLVKNKCEEITDGAHVSPITEGGQHHFISITDIKKGFINFDNALLTTTENFNYLVKTGCMPLVGDILFSKDGTIGQTVITPENIDFVVASSLIIIRPKKSLITSEYFNFLLQSGAVVEQVESFVKGAALRRLSIQNLMKVRGIFPPISEQNEISHYLNRTHKKFDVLERNACNLIKLLQERRTALISAAVTGKIDVRNWQAPEALRGDDYFNRGNIKINGNEIITNAVE